jgi:hypothetical protein
VVERHIVARKAEAAKERITLTAEVQRCRQVLEVAQNATADHLAAWQQNITGDPYHAYGGPDEHRYMDIKGREFQAQADLTAAAEKLAGLLKGSFYFEGMPTAKLATQTDAEGEFTLTVPSFGKYALVAHAGRMVSDNTEEYFWVLKLPPDAAKGKPVLLSNSTMTTAGSPLSLLQTKE